MGFWGTIRDELWPSPPQPRKQVVQKASGARATLKPSASHQPTSKAPLDVRQGMIGPAAPKNEPISSSATIRGPTQKAGSIPASKSATAAGLNMVPQGSAVSPTASVDAVRSGDLRSSTVSKVLGVAPKKSGVVQNKEVAHQSGNTKETEVVESCANAGAAPLIDGDGSVTVRDPKHQEQEAHSATATPVPRRNNPKSVRFPSALLVQAVEAASILHAKSLNAFLVEAIQEKVASVIQKQNAANAGLVHGEACLSFRPLAETVQGQGPMHTACKPK